VTPLAVALAALLAAPARGDTVPASRHVLTNGMRVIVRESGDASVVAMSLQVPTGAPADTGGSGIVNFLQRAMLRGAGRRTARQLAEAAEALGGAIEASADAETAEVRGAALARNWDALLGLIADIALAPALAPDEVERERRLILAQIRTRAERPLPLVVDTLMAELYGPHPYALPPLGRTSSIERVSRDALAARHRALYRPDRMVLAVSGRVDRDRVVRLAERLFDRLPRAGEPVPPAAASAVASGQRRVIERPGHQAQIAIGFPAPGVEASDYAALKLAGAVLGGGMASRLFVALRGQAGLAYSVGAQMPFRIGPGFLMVYTGTAPDNIAVAEAGMRRELERLRTEGVTEAELARAKRYLVGALAIDRRTNARRAWYLARFETVGVGWDFPERYVRAVEAATADDVLTAARRYLVRPTTVVLEPRP
jgi:predicted Zn-dependent peptidase